MFGFPFIQREMYKNTFLRKVELVIQFNPVVDKRVLIDNAKEHLSPKFPNIEDNQSKDYAININGATPTIQVSSEAKGLKLLSADRKNILFVDNGLIKYIVDGVNYEGFESVKQSLCGVLPLLKSLDVIEIKQASLQKINIFGFDTNDNPVGALKDLINSELLGNIDYCPNSKLQKQNIGSVIYQDDNEQFNIIYGLSVIPQTSNPTKGQIVVDILRSSNNVATESLWSKIDSNNSEIFNAFNWTISERAKQLLRG